ncbi:MAG TPA: type IX secretion system membrane protein PorP/SprF [Bacteroidales bacterium]|nr:type IX secretion system membrane protein PorP/SprF [Bacteroidales bacterium]HRU57240.1 type IX secretion system membrane protein PorP/SprF [Bacteroidales bacterium]
MKKYGILFIFALILAGRSFPQQDPVYSQYMYNFHFFNPGSAGISGMVCMTATSRQQWLGFKGAPSTTGFSVNAPVRLFGSESGIGMVIMNDKTGFDSDIKLSGSYSYHFELGNGKLGVGISLGMMNKTLNPSWQIPESDAHTPVSGDPLIPENKESHIAFDAGVGAYYSTEKYYAGISITHINEPKIKFSKGEPYLSRHYYATAGYSLNLGNPSYELIPSVFVFSDGHLVQFTINSMLRYNKKVWGGVSYRAGDALTGIVGIELYNGIRIGYSYDFILSDIRKSSSGSHEFMVNYCFDISLGKSPMKYKSVRFL